MADNSQLFARRLAFRAKGITENVERAVRKAAIAADKAVVLTTPVDTGRARANWVTSAGELRNRVDNNKFDQNGLSTIAEGMSEIARWNLSMSSIFISNGVAYITLLENGWSKQAPHGMTVHGVQAAEAQLRAARLLR